ncbi:MAG: flagellar basal body rod protein FlgC [Myxococcales bacterium]|nr:flagellar basal body rod protein FlgC [Myxococcota bacterium]MDW8282825.1 flagellar basal body rod protein FlgC [Myxococcales bacterium]
MDLFTGLDILSSGLSAERTRMNVTASNLANLNTTRTDAGGPYQRIDPVLATTSMPRPFRDVLEAQLHGVTVKALEPDPTPPRIVYDPGHPDADQDGYVQLPNINMVAEMVNMITASRSYEAGVTAMQSIKAMAQRALSIGR